MFDQLLRAFGSLAPTWATWQAVSILDTALILAVITAVWLVVRKKAPAQFGYFLFLSCWMSSPLQASCTGAVLPI